MMKVDPKQITLIHIARAQLGLTEENYRAIIAGRTQGKKDSSADLAARKELEQRGFKLIGERWER